MGLGQLLQTTTNPHLHKNSLIKTEVRYDLTRVLVFHVRVWCNCNHPTDYSCLLHKQPTYQDHGIAINLTPDQLLCEIVTIQMGCPGNFGLRILRITWWEGTWERIDLVGDKIKVNIVLLTLNQFLGGVRGTRSNEQVYPFGRCQLDPSSYRVCKIAQALIVAFITVVLTGRNLGRFRILQPPAAWVVNPSF